jgi:hypothetical protein
MNTSGPTGEKLSDVFYYARKLVKQCTLEEFGSMLDVTETMLSYVEKEKRFANISMIRKLVKEMKWGPEILEELRVKLCHEKTMGPFFKKIDSAFNEESLAYRKRNTVKVLMLCNASIEKAIEKVT